MKIGIIGSGGREHAICKKILESNKKVKIYCFPGNGGTASVATNVNISYEDYNKFKNFIIKKKIELVIIGPEKPLVDGLSEKLGKLDIKVFGPNKHASKLEGSKIFTKKICKNYRIPTPNFKICFSKRESYLFLKKANFPLVVKADGLASGKGVYICKNKKFAKKAINEIFGGKFGITSNLLIEEFISGEEMSFFIISDGLNYKLFETAQDHKRIFEADKGPNTGGMGCYSPSRLVNQELKKKIINKIIEPTLNALKINKSEYVGFLYAGLMIKNNEPYLIEFNVRMGDPECQTILPRLKSNLLKLIIACCKKKLKNFKIKWHRKKSLSIVLCSKGYPGLFKKNIEIKNLNLKSKTFISTIYHAGTFYKDNKYYSNGGRVLNFVHTSNSFKKIRNQIISEIRYLDWKNGFYRKDIGYRVIK